MTKGEVIIALAAYVDKYVAEQRDFPNTEIALLDDFGAWLLKFQDDAPQGAISGD